MRSPALLPCLALAIGKRGNGKEKGGLVAVFYPRRTDYKGFYVYIVTRVAHASTCRVRRGMWETAQKADNEEKNKSNFSSWTKNLTQWLLSLTSLARINPAAAQLRCYRFLCSRGQPRKRPQGSDSWEREGRSGQNSDLVLEEGPAVL